MPTLPTRILGRTGLPVTVLGFGALELRGMVAGVGRPLTPGQPERILNAVLDAGINYIDVAVDYGEAEAHIGRCIAHRRHEFFLASKCGCPLDVTRFTPRERTRFGVPLPRLHDYGRTNIMAAVHQSLRRMRTDYLDVLQFHFSPAREVVEQEGALETLHDLQRAGTIRFLGCSSTLPHLTAHIAMGVFDVLQIPYSALQPEHEAAISAAAQAGAGIVIRGGVARGAPGPGQGATDVWQRWEHAKMDELLEGMSATVFLLRFTLTHPDVHTTIVGTLNPAHLQENITAVVHGPLSMDVYHEARRRLAAVHVGSA
jgi:aryl-alcohol dehydrogenase-like predicted oxidoreductase